MLALFAVLLPFMEVSAGPSFLLQPGRPGIGHGPEVRMTAGLPLGDRFAGELWASGVLETAPLRAPGDRALLGGGVGGRMLVRASSDAKLTLWARGGVGWSAVAGQGQPGPSGFAGGLISYQPFVKRFQLGVELDALAFRNTFGLAVLPSLRCEF